MIRVGIVGVGGISSVHINGYDEIPNATLVAAADPLLYEAKNAHLIRERNIPLYASMEEMLANEKIDLIDICTPTDTHVPIALAALAAGKHVLSEKPMARTSAEGEKLLEAVKASGKRYMTAHVVRFMKPFAYLADVVKSGELGDPLHLRFSRVCTTPTWSVGSWMADLARSGGAPLDLAIHDIDLVQYMLGEPKDVVAYRHPLSDADPKKRDYFTASLFYDGVTVDITGAFYPSGCAFSPEYSAAFEDGYVESRKRGIEKNGQPIDVKVAVAKADGTNLTSDSAYAEEIAYFIHCIEEGCEASRVTPESSLATVRLVERIAAAAREV